MSIKEKIKKIINCKYVKKGKDTLQKKSVKCLFAFLFIMVMCTMLSRAANSMTIPRVKTDKPKTKTIVDEVKAQGRVIKNREEKIATIEGLKVDYVNVSIGSSVKVGDTLVELDVTDLETKINEINENIAKDQKVLSRVTEDYKRAIASKKQMVQVALNEMNSAKQALDNYLGLSEEEKEKDPFMEENLNMDYQSKKDMYNQAVADSNDTVDLDRTLQDTKDSLQIDEYNKELAKLQPLLDASGKIVSDKEGIVTSIYAENGGITTDTIVSLADKNSGYKFIGQIEKSNRTLVKQGQSVALNLGSAGIVDKLTVEAISINKESSEYLDVTVVLPIGIGEIDDTGEIIISSKSKKYGTCVPIAALRQGDGSEYYILVISEKETVLGEELIAKKVDIKVEKKDGEFAAINDGSIGRSEEVIIDSNKTVEDNDRVRLENE